MKVNNTLFFCVKHIVRSSSHYDTGWSTYFDLFTNCLTGISSLPLCPFRDGRNNR